MSNQIRLEQKRQNRVNNEDFIVVDAPFYGADFVSCSYLIKKEQVRFESLRALCFFINKKPYSYPLSKNKVSFSASSFNSEYRAEVRELYTDYLFSIWVKCPSSLVDMKYYTNQMEQMSLAKRLISKACNISMTDLEIYKKYAVSENRSARNDFLSELKRLTVLNLIPNCFMAKLPYGEDKVISTITKGHIEEDYSKLLSGSLIIGSYIGNTDFRPVVSFKNSVNPSSKIFPLEIKPTVLSSIRELVKTENISDSGMSIIYKVPSSNSQQMFLLNMIFKLGIGSLFFERGISLIDSSVFHRAGVVVFFFAGNDRCFSEKEKERMLDRIQAGITEKSFFDNSKLELLYRLSENLSPYQRTEREIQSRLLGVNLGKNVLLSSLEKITSDTFQAYIKEVSYYGSLILNGEEK